MSRAHKGAFTSKPEPTFPSDFFAALQKGDEDEAMVCLKAEALPDGEPSPRARVLMQSGEWDSSQKLALAYVETDACTGRVGNDDYRFCGKPKNFCVVSAHSKTTVGNVRPGWYISFGKAHGLLTTPFLPPYEEGGPITPLIASRLLVADKAFKMTKGQWKFVIDAWHALKVEAVSDSGASHSDKSIDNHSEAEDALSVGQTKTERLRIDTTTTTTHHDDEEDAFLAAFASIPSGDRYISDLVLFLKQANEQNARELTLVKAYYDRTQVEVQELIATNRLLQTKTRTLEEELRTYRIRHDHSGTELQVQALKERLETLEEAVERNATTGTDHNRASEQGLVDKVEQLDVAMFGAGGAFSRFKTSFLEFKEKLESGGGIECNGVSFKSQGDFLTWFHAEDPSIDIFLDAIAFMHGISAPVWCIRKTPLNSSSCR